VRRYNGIANIIAARRRIACHRALRHTRARARARDVVLMISGSAMIDISVSASRALAP